MRALIVPTMLSYSQIEYFPNQECVAVLIGLYKDCIAALWKFGNCPIFLPNMLLVSPGGGGLCLDIHYDEIR